MSSSSSAPAPSGFAGRAPPPPPNVRLHAVVATLADRRVWLVRVPEVVAEIVASAAARDRVLARFTLVSGGEGAGAGAGAGAGKSGKRGLRSKGHAEKDEDAELIEAEAGAGKPGVKLTRQPSLVQGQMRDYQLEGLNWMMNLHDNNISGM